MPSILGESSVARWLSMPALSGIEGRHGSCHFVPVLCVSATDLSDGRDNFPGHAEALGDLVPRDVVCDEPEEWSQRVRVAACLGVGEL